jgi:hypothetical protein
VVLREEGDTERNTFRIGPRDQSTLLEDLAAAFAFFDATERVL